MRTRRACYHRRSPESDTNFVEECGGLFDQRCVVTGTRSHQSALEQTQVSHTPAAAEPLNEDVV